MGELDDLLASLDGFEWDEANADKNWRRHAVRQAEAEQVLLSGPLVAPARTEGEEVRLIALGATDTGRLLTVVFTVRGARVRVISARPMSRQERRIHATATADPAARA